MEPTNERPKAPPKEGATGGPFATGTKKVERIAQQSMGLIDDLKDWIELKIKLTELEIQDKLVGYGALAVLGSLAVVFALITLALGLGAWLGHPAWGFLSVTVLLLVLVAVLYWAHFGRKKKKAPKAEESQKALAPSPDNKSLPPGSPKPEPSTATPKT